MPPSISPAKATALKFKQLRILTTEARKKTRKVRVKKTILKKKEKRKPQTTLKKKMTLKKRNQKTQTNQIPRKRRLLCF